MQKLRYFFLFLGLLLMSPTLQAQQTAFERKLAELRLDRSSLIDLSDSSEVRIPTPNCVYVNITGISSMPWSKTDAASVDMPATLEMYDGNGHYLRKQAILNAQGNSSLWLTKKNFSADFGEDSVSFAIGEWVPQDGFHFKAYYYDKFRGTGAVGYWLYDQVVGTHESFLARAGLEDTGARCYPDGFPCVVYLNGTFHGIFAWQLKKHRRNMAQKKDNEQHIHLEGEINSSSFWNGTIKWDKLSVRNPKTLYAVNLTPAEGDAVPTYQKYDKDNSVELIDSTMPYYNPEKSAHRRTSYVKSRIQAFSKYYGELSRLSVQGKSMAEMRQEVESRFDVTSIIDYIVFYYLTNNYDGFDKNWQWFTYDGVRWSVAPYDLDGIFGAHFSGNIIQPAMWNNAGLSRRFSSLSYNLGGPTYYVIRYFYNDIVARVKELREMGVLSTDNVVSLMRKWESAVTASNYAAEWERWPQSPCILTLKANPGWSATGDWTNYTRRQPYDPNKTYYPGNYCQDHFYEWQATDTVCGVQPYAQLGFEDNLERVAEWVDDRLGLIDRYAGYTLEDLMESYTLSISSAGWATLCLPFSFRIPEGVKCFTVEGVDEAGEVVCTEEVDYTLANHPYLVAGAPGRYLLTGLPELQDTLDLHNGLLTGTYEDIYAAPHTYVLQNHNGDVGFYQVANADDVRLSANRAYLTLPQVSATRRFRVAPMELPTGITPPVSSSQRIDAMYNIIGVPVGDVQTGITIMRMTDGSVRKILR